MKEDDLRYIAKKYKLTTIPLGIEAYNVFYEEFTTNVSVMSPESKKMVRPQVLSNAEITRQNAITSIMIKQFNKNLVELFKNVELYTRNSCKSYDLHRLLNKIKTTIKSSPRPFQDVEQLDKLIKFTFTNSTLKTQIQLMFSEIVKAMIDDIIAQCSMLVGDAKRKLVRLDFLNNEEVLNDPLIVPLIDKFKNVYLANKTRLDVKDDFEIKFVDESSAEGDNQYVLGRLDSHTLTNPNRAIYVESVLRTDDVVFNHLELFTNKYNSKIRELALTYIVRKTHHQKMYARDHTETQWIQQMLTYHDTSVEKLTQICHMDVLCFGPYKQEIDIDTNKIRIVNDAQYRFLESTPDKIRFLYTNELCTVNNAILLQKMYESLGKTWPTESPIENLMNKKIVKNEDVWDHDHDPKIEHHFKNPLFVQQGGGKSGKVVKNLKTDISRSKCGKEMKSCCPRGKVINPKTGKCVYADGKIGKELALKEKEMNKKAANKAAKALKH